MLRINNNSNRIILKAKKIISLALVFLLSITIILSITAVVYKINSSNKNEITVYALDNGTLSESDYNSNTYFIISTTQGLFNFANAVNKGFSFYKKHVNLYDDIDLSGYEWVPIGAKSGRFEGMFDGNNCTIKNITCGEEYERSYCALFSWLGGIKWQESHWLTPNDYYDCFPYVRNLRIENMTILKNYYSSGGFTAAALACFVGGDMQISNVEVSGLTVKAKEGYNFTPCIWVGGLVAFCDYADGSDVGKVSNVVIENCYVENFNANMEVYSNSYGGLGHYTSDYCISGIGPSAMRYFKGEGLNVCTVKNSVFKKSSSSWKFTGDLTVEQKDIAKNDAPDYNYTTGFWWWKEDHNVSGSDLSVKTENCCSAAQSSIDAFEDWGNVVSIADSNKWFFDSTFNDGFPKLQSWVGKKARFDIYPKTKTEEGYVEIDEFNVFDSYNAFQPDPKDKTYVKDILDINSSTAELKIGDKILVATPSQDKYEFEKWDYLYVPAGTEYHNRDYDFDLHIYTAKFKLKKCKVTFVANALAEFSGVTSVDIIQNNKITITRILNADKTFTYEYTMINANDEKVTVQYKLKHPKHTMIGVEESGEILVTGTSLIINPEFELKNYDINLG